MSHILREPERWSLLAGSDWWKHLAEIAFHIHPEDATEEDRYCTGVPHPTIVLWCRALVVRLCELYALQSDPLVTAGPTKPERKEVRLFY